MVKGNHTWQVTPTIGRGPHQNHFGFGDIRNSDPKCPKWRNFFCLKCQEVVTIYQLVNEEVGECGKARL